MTRKAHYSTVSEAITALRKQGFTHDFNLEENCISCPPHRFNHDEFEIVDIYYYEGNSDPADEATVYAIESKTGVKGILVTGQGVNADKVTTEMLKKLTVRR